MMDLTGTTLTALLIIIIPVIIGMQFFKWFIEKEIKEWIDEQKD